MHYQPFSVGCDFAEFIFIVFNANLQGDGSLYSAKAGFDEGLQDRQGRGQQWQWRRQPRGQLRQQQWRQRNTRNRADPVHLMAGPVGAFRRKCALAINRGESGNRLYWAKEIKLIFSKIFGDPT